MTTKILGLFKLSLTRWHSEKTLSRKINQATIIIVAAAGVFAAGVVVLQNFLKNRVSTAAIQESLIRSTQEQMDSLLPIFILPEQRGGLEVYLNEVARRESLDAIRFIPPNEKLPLEFQDCVLSAAPSVCISSTEQAALSAVVVPIGEAGHSFGFLFKAKRVDRLLDQNHTLRSLEIIAIVLLAIMLLLIFGVSRIVSNQVPQALNQLTNWIEQVMREGSNVTAPNLPFEEFNKLGRRIAEIIQKEQAIREQANLGAMASQVSHDIRSPLSALSMVVGSLKELPEEKRLIVRGATQRINDIANNLLLQSKKPNAQGNTKRPARETPSASEPVMLVALLDSIISEKRMQFRDRMEVEISGELNRGYGLFSGIESSQFSRVISNLVNNSVESMNGPGHVTISIRGQKDKVAVFVSDDGAGIPLEILSRLGLRGVTHGKAETESGSGLGLSHAIETIREVGGDLAIQSTEGRGTIITITLPRAGTPTWFVQELNVSANATVVTCDDDQTIHQVWDGRLASAGGEAAGVRHIRLSTTEQLKAWVLSSLSARDLFLIDYEFLGQTETGLDAIESLGIASQSVLVTSRYEEPHVRSRAIEYGLRILPKGLAPFVPLKIEEPQVRYDALVIDDDIAIVHQVWKMAAQEHGKQIACFVSSDEFLVHAASYDRSSPVFIDVNLGDDERGEDVAVRVAELGFSEIMLATGYRAESVAAPLCVKRVIGKDPIFV